MLVRLLRLMVAQKHSPFHIRCENSVGNELYCKKRFYCKCIFYKLHLHNLIVNGFVSHLWKASTQCVNMQVTVIYVSFPYKFTWIVLGATPTCKIKKKYAWETFRHWNLSKRRLLKHINLIINCFSYKCCKRLFCGVLYIKLFFLIGEIK